MGVGSNTAILSVVDAAWLRPLPFDEASALASFWLENPSEVSEERLPLTGADLADFRAEPGLFSALSGWLPTTPTLTGAGPAEVLRGAAITEGMFARVLRVQPLLGRSFLPEEDRPGAPRTVLLSHGFWNERFGGDPGAIGRSVVLDGEPHVIVGVMPPGFRPPFRSDAALWTPARLALDRCRAGCPGAPAIGRLAPGTTLPVARDHAEALAGRLAESYPDTNGGITARLVELRHDRARISAATVRLLLAAGGLVLVLACANVGMLLVARGVDRSREMRLRRSLGAGGPALGRQLMIESAVLAAIGGLVGLGVASWGVAALVGMAPPELAGLGEIGVSGRVLLFVLVLTSAAGVLSGIAPAFVIGRGEGRIVRGHDVGPSDEGSGLWAFGRRGLVVAEVAVAMMLAVGAGTLFQAFERATSLDVGFEPERLLAMSVTFPRERFPEEARKALLIRTLSEKLEEVPGAFSVGATSALPLVQSATPVTLRIEDDPVPSTDQARVAQLRRVTEGYFYTVGQRLAEGRWFGPRDDEESPPVAILNMTAARRLFLDPPRSPIGARIALGGSESPAWRTVVGVVRDADDDGRDRHPEAVVYLPIPQSPPQAVTMVVRMDGDPEAGAERARAALAEVDRTLAAARVDPVSDLIEEAYATERFGAALGTAFAVVALVLSMVGLYGIIAHGVASRIRELGVRKAIGAGDEDLRRRIVGRALLFSATGVLLGTLGSGFVVRGIGAALGGVGVGTPMVYAVCVMSIALVSLVASAQPARRSIAIDPAGALRAE